jgi:glutamine synthetase adenylyltransferase
MYTKLRHVAGTRSLAQKATATTGALFQRFAADPLFSHAVREMRAKLEAAAATEKNFKTSSGGLYDIDFIVALLLIKRGVGDKNGSLRDRIWRCVAAGALSKSDAAILDHAAELLRTVEHVVRLAIGRARKWLPATEHASQVTAKLVAAILGRNFPEGLEKEILRSFDAVREIFNHVCSA